MRTFLILALAAVMLALAWPAAAELQTVQVGGEVRIRGNWYTNYTVDPTPAGNDVRWFGLGLAKRPLGLGGNAAILGGFSWDDNSNDVKYVEQRTRLNVKADFTNDVSAFIELDSYDVWGEDFRSDYVTGADFRANTAADVEVYQSYIEAKNMWGMPLSAKIGRQEMKLGSQWLVGVNDTAAGFTGLSFDGIRLTYGTDLFSVDAFATKLAENGTWEQDGDTDFYGVYASYKGIENVSIDAYMMWLRDAGRLNDTNRVWFGEWIENVLGLDDYDVTNLYTAGLRGAGTLGQFDFEAEAAYQWGDAGQVGWLFAPLTYGDAGASFSNWGGNLEVGYTFDMAMQPRIYLGGAYLGGEDNRDLSWLDWINPFYKPEASVSFNRLFSNWEYSEFIENTELSNAWVGRGGVSIKPTETTKVLLAVSYFESLDGFDAPYFVKLGRYRVPLFPWRSYATKANDTDLGWEVGLYGTYNYTEDLSFNAGYVHLFTGQGLTDGAYSALNGLAFTGGSDNDDADYFFFETKLAF